MADTQTWTIKQYSRGGSYEWKASATWSNTDAARFESKFDAYTKASNMVKTVAPVDGNNKKITLVATDTAAGGGTAQQGREAFISDIDGIQDALAAQTTEVTDANTPTTGSIAVFATGKITISLGEP